MARRGTDRTALDMGEQRMEITSRRAPPRRAVRIPSPPKYVAAARVRSGEETLAQRRVPLYADLPVQLSPKRGAPLALPPPPPAADAVPLSGSRASDRGGTALDFGEQRIDIVERRASKSRATTHVEAPPYVVSPHPRGTRTVRTAAAGMPLRAEPPLPPPLLALPAPRPMLALPAPSPKPAQLALPAPPPTLALPAPPRMLALPAPPLPPTLALPAPPHKLALPAPPPRFQPLPPVPPELLVPHEGGPPLPPTQNLSQVALAPQYGDDRMLRLNAIGRAVREPHGATAHPDLYGDREAREMRSHRRERLEREVREAREASARATSNVWGERLDTLAARVREWSRAAREGLYHYYETLAGVNTVFGVLWQAVTTRAERLFMRNGRPNWAVIVPLVAAAAAGAGGAAWYAYGGRRGVAFDDAAARRMVAELRADPARGAAEMRRFIDSRADAVCHLLTVFPPATLERILVDSGVMSEPEFERHVRACAANDGKAHWVATPRTVSPPPPPPARVVVSLPSPVLKVEKPKSKSKSKATAKPKPKATAKPTTVGKPKAKPKARAKGKPKARAKGKTK